MKLGEVIKQRKGFITIDDDKDYKLCRVQVHRKGVVLRGIVKGKDIKTKKQQVCKAGDFLVAEMDAKVGGYGFVPEELDGAIVSSHYFLFELDESKIRPAYLEIISKLQILQDQIKAVGSTNYAAIRPVNVLNWKIPYSSIDNQVKIEKLYKHTEKNSLALKDEINHQQALLKQLRQAFLREAMMGKLIPQNTDDEPATELLKKIKAEKKQLIKDKKLKKEKPLPPIKSDEIPYEIPENWAWCRLGHVIDLISGQHIDSHEYNLDGKGFPYMTGPSDFGKTFPIPTRWTTKPRVFSKTDDILITVKGSGVGKLNICNLPKIVIGRQLMAVRPILLSRDFIYNFIRISFDLLQSKMKGTGIPGISRENILNLMFPLPPLAEQNRIVKKLEELVNMCAVLESSINTSRQQNEALLQQVLREALQPTPKAFSDETIYAGQDVETVLQEA